MAARRRHSPGCGLHRRRGHQCRSANTARPGATGTAPASCAGPLSPAQIEDRVDRGIRHAAIELDATPEQQEKLRAIAKGAVKDLAAHAREGAGGARARAAELLTQPKVDRAAIEAFRAEQLALADAASKRFAQAVGDAAEVLTPEQRQKAHDMAAMAPGLLAPLASRLVGS